MSSTAKKLPTEPVDLLAKSDWVRSHTLQIHKIAPETRVASSLSPVEIFTALFYSGAVRFDAKNPHWEGRDRVVISKGHGSLCMYPILADLGFFPQEELTRVCSKGSFLGGIPDPIIPGYETVNGSLGHGVGVGAGMAKALKTKGSSNHVFVVTGDGELHEGSVWEGFMFAGHHQLDNLIVIVDRNKHCMLGSTSEIMSLDPLDRKFQAFGFEVADVDGHDPEILAGVYHDFIDRRNGRPKVIIANTLKGKGAPQLETNPLSHITGLSTAEVDILLKGKIL